MHELFTRRRLPGTIGILLLTFAAAAVIFLVTDYPLLFLLYPLLLLVDSLLAFSGAAIAVLGVCLVGVFLTIHNHGPFGAWPADRLVTRDLALQIYFGFHMIALFPASVLFMERRQMAQELRDTNARLTVLASLDGLTGIPNRRSFDERYAQEWQRAASLRIPLTLAMIDLDHFKQFNDLYGHLAGDQCLRRVAELIAGRIMRPQDFAARFGGEEFAVLLPNTDREGAQPVTEGIRTAVLELAIDHIGNPRGLATVSVGYATVIPGPGDTEAGLIQLADASLYQAKRRGRNRVETLTLVEGLQAAEDQTGTTSRNRLLRILGRG
jgi:diguanylate cyclase (GGDEF)-like protein